MNYTLISALVIGIMQIHGHATSSTATAGELDLVGKHLVADRDMAVEWTRDANLVKTLCSSDSPLWKSFDPASVKQGTGRSTAEICAQNGLMNWYEAKAWIGVLNKHAYLGHSDWRLPRIQQKDSSCSLHIKADQAGSTVSLGHGCLSSEPGHLFHASLDNPVYEGSACQDNCLTNHGPFSNLSGNMYWTDTEIAFDTSLVGVFDPSNDWQDAEKKTSDLLLVWPVHAL